MSRDLPLHEKIALVTGGSRGIGAATVRRLVEDGARVAFTYSHSAEAAQALVEQSNGRAFAYKADAMDLDGLAQLADQVAADLGPIDILVNNAGIFEFGVIGETTLEDYQRTMRVNVDAVFALTNAVVKTMPNGGRIINISSVIGERAGGGNLSTYTTSKSAVIGQTQGWAHDLGSKNILVNAILPGPIATDMNPATSEMAKMLVPLIPMRRYGQPEEIANVVAFLAGPQASFINGATIRVDGGYNA